MSCSGLDTPVCATLGPPPVPCPRPRPLPCCLQPRPPNAPGGGLPTAAVTLTLQSHPSHFSQCLGVPAHRRSSHPSALCLPTPFLVRKCRPHSRCRSLRGPLLTNSNHQSALGLPTRSLSTATLTHPPNPSERRSTCTAITMCDYHIHTMCLPPVP